MMEPGKKYSIHDMAKLVKNNLVYEKGPLQHDEVRNLIGRLVASGSCEVTLDGNQFFITMCESVSSASPYPYRGEA